MKQNMVEKSIQTPVVENIDQIRERLIPMLRELDVKITGKIFKYKSGETGDTYYDARKALFETNALVEVLKAFTLLIPKDATYIVLSGISGEFISGLLANVTGLPVSVVYTKERDDLPKEVDEVDKHFAYGQRLPNNNDKIIFIDDTYNKGTATKETDEVLWKYIENRITYKLVVLDRNEADSSVVSIVRASEI